MTAMGTTRAEKALAAELITAWGPNPICGRCGHPIEDGQLDVGHIVDRSAGGTYTLDNLRPEHKHCNRSDGGRLGAKITNSRPRRRPGPRKRQHRASRRW